MRFLFPANFEKINWENNIFEKINFEFPTIGEEKGKIRLAITDAPVDDKAVIGVILSVSEVQAISQNGIHTLTKYDKPISFNLMDYQDNDLLDLGSGELDIDKYSGIRFVLCPNLEATHVLMEGGAVAPLQLEENNGEYTVNFEFEIVSNQTLELIMDIDLRKALIKDNRGYKLRSTARLISADRTGTITGHITNSTPNERIVVYAYKQGQFQDSETEQVSETDTVRFEHSVNSSLMDEKGDFELAFMTEGSYDLIFARYKREETLDSYVFDRILEAHIQAEDRNITHIKVSPQEISHLSIHLSEKYTPK